MEQILVIAAAADDEVLRLEAFGDPASQFAVDEEHTLANIRIARAVLRKYDAQASK